MLWRLVVNNETTLNLRLRKIYLEDVSNDFSFCSLSKFLAADSKFLKTLLSFAVGGLLGDVFLHLLPEAWEYDMKDRNGNHHLIIYQPVRSSERSHSFLF